MSTAKKADLTEKFDRSIVIPTDIIIEINKTFIECVKTKIKDLK